MPNRTSLTVLSLFLVVNFHASQAQSDTKKEPTKQKPEPSAKRGELAARTVSSPLTATLGAWSSIWKQWSQEKPDDFLAAVNDRYGLHPDTQESGFPLGLKKVSSPFGSTLGHNCLLCHAGRVAGKTVIGLGNASLDLQSLIDDLTAGEAIQFPLPVKIGRGRGIIEAVAGTIYLLEFRDVDLNQRSRQKLINDDQLCEDVPAWWLLKYKKTMFHTGGTDARSTRANVSFFLNPLNTGEFVKAQEPTVADIREFILTLEAPEYPFPIDQSLAAKGKELFVENCSECHGTYGNDRHYPNVIVPAEEVGTDPALAKFSAVDDRPYYEAHWLYTEKGPDGEPYQFVNRGGYQAPPLDGVWATAPYFHNGSVPTIADVLNSKSRPKIYTRSFSTEKEAYDQKKVGWKTSPVEAAVVEKAKGHELRRITDTRSRGRRNTGHTYGDHLSDQERAAVLEYLKTL